MAIVPSHKNPAVASADHYQPRSHSHTGTKYGEDKRDHPNRKVERYYNTGKVPFDNGDWETADLP